MAAVGTKRTWRSGRDMSVIGATADVICSERVFRLLTHFGHRPLAQFIRYCVCVIGARPSRRMTAASVLSLCRPQTSKQGSGGRCRGYLCCNVPGNPIVLVGVDCTRKYVETEMSVVHEY